MFRSLGQVFLVTTAAGLAVAVAVILIGGFDDRLASATKWRLTALDAAAPVGPHRAEALVILEDLDYARPVPDAELVFRFEDGYVGATRTGRTGRARCRRNEGLAEGRHPFEVFLSETSPRLGVRARGTIWARPPEVPVVWVDAAALVPCGATRCTEGLSAAPQKALSALGALAATHQAVYLVATGLGDYALVRRRLGDLQAPPGPAIWVEPEAERRSLERLKRTWPRVRAALLCSPRLAEAAAHLKVQVLPVPPIRARQEVAADRETSSGEVLTWPEVIERLAALETEAVQQRR
ncbi:MAG: hypothetical protein WBD05_06125 [Phycisphaerae bacterium]